MAGGEGTRLRPLTSNQPKPMVPVAGKPCMQHIIELLRRHGMTDIVVTVAYLPQVIRGYFDDGEALGVELHYSVEERPLGTAGSVKNAEELLDETFLVISGDALCDFDLDALIDDAQVERRRRHAGAEVGRQPARVRRRHRRLGRSRGAIPGEAVVGPGVLGHDQHRRLRARAGGAAGRAAGHALRLLQAALPGPARARKADPRPRRGGLLAGHRQPRPVPPGELRRPRRPRRARALGHPPARQRAARRGRAAARPGADRGAGLHRQLLPDRRRRARRAVHGARPERGREGGRHRRSQHGRLGQLRRPQRPAGGHDPGQGRGRARPRRPERGRLRRRRVLDRRRGGAGPGHQGVPVQDDRGRRGDPRQPDLGVARHHDAVRPRRRHRARERRHHLRGGRPARRRLRHDALAGRTGRVQPRRPPIVADGEAGDHRGPGLDRRARRRPARCAADREPARAEGGGAGRRPARARRHRRPRRRPDQLLRAAGDPRGRIRPEGDRADVLAAGVPAGEPRRDRRPDLPGPRHRELRPGAPERRSTATRSAAAGSGSCSTTAFRRPRSCCRR